MVQKYEIKFTFKRFYLITSYLFQALVYYSWYIHKL